MPDMRVWALWGEVWKWMFFVCSFNMEIPELMQPFDETGFRVHRESDYFKFTGARNIMNAITN